MAEFQFNPIQYDGSNPAISYLGTPVQMPLSILAGREQINRTDYEEYDGIILRSAVIDVSQSKNIVKTTVEGRNGTFKEYISDGDYQISIKGRLFSENPSDGVPLYKMKVLQRIGKVAGAIEVQNELLNELGIFEIVIESYDFTNPKGNTIDFSISAVSEFALIVQEKNAKILGN